VPITNYRLLITDSKFAFYTPAKYSSRYSLFRLILVVCWGYKTDHLPTRPCGIVGKWYRGCFVRRVAATAALLEKPIILAASHEVLWAPNKESP